jgi:streptogramin lyase
MDTTPELFPLGRVVATPGALTALLAAAVDPANLLGRHVTGDWGELCQEDVRENEYSLKRGLRLLSSYPMPDGDRIWIITEANRSVTTLLVPSEY